MASFYKAVRFSGFFYMSSDVPKFSEEQLREKGSEEDIEIS